MLTFRLFIESDAPQITSVSKYAGTIWVSVIIQEKKYTYHLPENPRVWRIIKQMRIPGAEWQALNAMKKEAESVESQPT